MSIVSHIFHRIEELFEGHTNRILKRMENIMSELDDLNTKIDQVVSDFGLYSKAITDEIALLNQKITDGAQPVDLTASVAKLSALHDAFSAAISAAGTPAPVAPTDTTPQP